MCFFCFKKATLRRLNFTSTTLYGVLKQASNLIGVRDVWIVTYSNEFIIIILPLINLSKFTGQDMGMLYAKKKDANPCLYTCMGSVQPDMCGDFLDAYGDDEGFCYCGDDPFTGEERAYDMYLKMCVKKSECSCQLDLRHLDRQLTAKEVAVMTGNTALWNVLALFDQDFIDVPHCPLTPNLNMPCRM